MLRAYALPKYELKALPDEFGKHAVLTSNFEFRYVQYLEHALAPQRIQHAFNQAQPLPRFLRSTPDAVCFPLKKIFYAHVRKSLSLSLFCTLGGAPHSLSLSLSLIRGVQFTVIIWQPMKVGGSPVLICP